VHTCVQGNRSATRSMIDTAVGRPLLPHPSCTLNPGPDSAIDQHDQSIRRNISGHQRTCLATLPR
jgi:hypothetical protein